MVLNLWPNPLYLCPLFGKFIGEMCARNNAPCNVSQPQNQSPLVFPSWWGDLCQIGRSSPVQPPLRILHRYVILTYASLDGFFMGSSCSSFVFCFLPFFFICSSQESLVMTFLFLCERCKFLSQFCTLLQGFSGCNCILHSMPW